MHGVGAGVWQLGLVDGWPENTRCCGHQLPSRDYRCTMRYHTGCCGLCIHVPAHDCGESGVLRDGRGALRHVGTAALWLCDRC